MVYQSQRKITKGKTHQGVSAFIPGRVGHSQWNDQEALPSEEYRFLCINNRAFFNRAFCIKVSAFVKILFIIMWSMA